MINTHPAKHSETLAMGMAKGSLREIDQIVADRSEKLYKVLRRKAASPTMTKKGAKRLLTTINKQLAPLAVTSLSINLVKEKQFMTAWLLPHIEGKQLQLVTHIVEQDKRGMADVKILPSMILSTHAIARLMQRDVTLNDLDWDTLRRALMPLVGQLWPVVIAHRMAGHKQFAVLSAQGLFVGTFDANGTPVVRTYLDGKTLSTKWGAVMGMLFRLAAFTEALAHAEAIPGMDDPHERLKFIVKCSALGLTVAPLSVLSNVYYEQLKQQQFDWMKDEPSG